MTTAELDDDLTSTIVGEPDPDQYDSTDEYETALVTWREQQSTTDLDAADRIARAYRRTQARIGAIDAAAARQIAQIEEWALAQRGKHQPALDWYQSQLEHFHRIEREADPAHNKQIPLPCGVTLTSSAGRISVVVDDDAAAVAWLTDHHAAALEWPPAKIVKTEVAKSFGSKATGSKEEGEFPAVEPDTGEVVPGIKLVRGAVSYRIS